MKNLLEKYKLMSNNQAGYSWLRRLCYFLLVSVALYMALHVEIRRNILGEIRHIEIIHTGKLKLVKLNIEQVSDVNLIQQTIYFTNNISTFNVEFLTTGETFERSHNPEHFNFADNRQA
jgi:hypothetical protein